jgi:hypothetical protein
MNPFNATQPILAPSYQTHHGVGMVEVLVSLVIIALGISGFGLAIPLGTVNLDGMREKRAALLLARQMMEEIQGKRYEAESIPGSFGLESGERPPRLNFDDIDDYDQWDESPPQYPDGTPVNGTNTTPDFSGLRRKVTVVNVSDTDYGAARADGTTNSKKITVTVSSEKSPPTFEEVSITSVANKEGMILLYP